jgi:hypothetical protein
MRPRSGDGLPGKSPTREPCADPDAGPARLASWSMCQRVRGNGNRAPGETTHCAGSEARGSRTAALRHRYLRSLHNLTKPAPRTALAAPLDQTGSSPCNGSLSRRQSQRPRTQSCTTKVWRRGMVRRMQELLGCRGGGFGPLRRGARPQDDFRTA